ncbi:MAG: zinc metalloprotease [Dysgonamonadaceae bacterium]|jgi:hypothetical protein|nr:zinc metalloprotease [Dysgonamonadaceae bacterium]
MKTRLLYTTIVLFALGQLVQAQRYCGSALNLTELHQTDPARYQRIMDLESQTQIRINGANSIPDSIIIPVVVHVLYRNTSENISNAQVATQIQVLNEDFRRLNADSTNTPLLFRNAAGRANIIFKLAAVDPNGNATSGITRKATTVNGFSKPSNNMKFNATGGQDAWDPYSYLNIWVCNFSDANLMGYAQFPDELASRTNTDGVVISYKYFGRGGSTTAPYDKGRTTTHEVGHWLNLRHIWGDEKNCTATDFVSDTPNQYEAMFGCPSYPARDACTTVTPGIMFMNYMDYTADGCMNLFTKGQVDRMLPLFDTQTGVRKQLLVNAKYLTGSSCVNNFANRTVTSNTSVGGCEINVWNVTVQNNAKLTLSATGTTTIEDTFEVASGAQLEIN